MDVDGGVRFLGGRFFNVDNGAYDCTAASHKNALCRIVPPQLLAIWLFLQYPQAFRFSCCSSFGVSFHLATLGVEVILIDVTEVVGIRRFLDVLLQRARLNIFSSFVTKDA